MFCLIQNLNILVVKGNVLQLITMGLVYFVSTDDLLAGTDPSEFGLEDDVAVLGFVIKQVNDDLEAYKVWKQQ